MDLFRKILIANRGEIAVRIIKAARKMGIATVAVCSLDERDALHAKMADECIELKGTTLSETYLNISQIIESGKKSGAEAVHPGYGFLSENEEFALACEDSGLIFIGPGSESIALMGNKTRARNMAVESGLPVIKGYTGSINELLARSGEMKFPLLLKAAAGGGGKGMRIVTGPEKLPELLEATSREATAYFGNSSVYIEEYIENPRHIEVQVLGDNYGNIIHLYERECSLQRRYQKIIEECPSPSISGQMRDELGNAAVKLARAINYRSAGTIEFLTDDKDNFYFLEMNTRIQVEHPVTEMVTQIDLVQEQIMIAAGHKLLYTQDQINLNGHAIECRIYSEDPSVGFVPSPGEMTCYCEPEGEGIRVDSGYDNEGRIIESYDPMIAKLITFGKERKEATEKMVDALGRFGIHGVKTNISFLLGLLNSDDFKYHRFYTTYCEENITSIIRNTGKIKSVKDWRIPAVSALLASLLRKTGRNQLWDGLGYWRAGGFITFCFEGEIVKAVINNFTHNEFDLIIDNSTFKGKYRFNGKRFTSDFNKTNRSVFISENTEGQYLISFEGFEYFFRRFDFLKKKDWSVAQKADHAGDNILVFSPMPGRVIKINKSSGETIREGDTLAIIESMKMENSIKAPADGIIENINISVGELIDGSMPIMAIKQLQE